MNKISSTNDKVAGLIGEDFCNAEVIVKFNIMEARSHKPDAYKI
jgi:hypothetical protein